MYFCLVFLFRTSGLSVQASKSKSAKSQADQRQRTPPIILGAEGEQSAIVVVSKPTAPTPAKRPTVQVSPFGQSTGVDVNSISLSAVLKSSTSSSFANKSSKQSEVPGNNATSGGSGVEVHDFQRFLRKTPVSPTTDVPPQPPIFHEEDAGPYDFKKFLRKTNFAPTESLRRRKGIVLPVTNCSTVVASQPVALPRSRPVAAVTSSLSRSYSNSASSTGSHQYFLSHQLSPPIQIISPIIDL